MSALLYVQQVILLVLFSFSFLLLMVEIVPERSLELVSALVDFIIFISSWGEYDGYKDFRNKKVAERPELEEELPESVIEFILFYEDHDDDKKGDKK